MVGLTCGVTATCAAMRAQKVSFRMPEGYRVSPSNTKAPGGPGHRILSQDTGIERTGDHRRCFKGEPGNQDHTPPNGTDEGR